MSDIRSEGPTRQFSAPGSLASRRSVGRRPFAGAAARRAIQDRGAETKAKLVAAGLEIFGRQGFESATTRQIAKAAGANLAAIVYHFGSKEGLYVAVAEDLVERLAGKIGGQIRDVAGLIEGADEAAARTMLHGVIATLVGAATADGTEADRWTRFIVREQLDPSPAAEPLHAFLGRIHELVCRLVGLVLRASPDDDETKLTAFALIGQALSFRIGRKLVLARLGVGALGPEQKDRIRRVVAATIDAVLGEPRAEAVPA